MSGLYPIFTDISGRRVVVVGGGQVARRKVQVLLKSQAQVVVISPELTEELAQLADMGLIELRKRCYQAGDLEGAWLVVAATGDEQVNRAVFEEAEDKRIFCNVVDVPQYCSFQVPSIVTRGNLQIAISTAGASPALARRIRERLEGQFGEYYQTFLKGLSEFRVYLKDKYPDDQARRAEILQSFVDSKALELLREGKTEQFQQLLDDWKKR